MGQTISGPEVVVVLATATAQETVVQAEQVVGQEIVQQLLLFQVGITMEAYNLVVEPDK
jgi:hypothetical protein